MLIGSGFLIQLSMVSMVCNLTNMSEVMNRYGLISINNATQPLTMTIDYECSGIIETMAYISIVAFFPIFNRYEKAFSSLQIL